MIKKIIGWVLIPYIMVGMLVSKKTNSKMAGIVVGLFTFLLLLSLGSTGSTNQQVNSIPETKVVSEIEETKEPEVQEESVKQVNVIPEVQVVNESYEETLEKNSEVKVPEVSIAPKPSVKPSVKPTVSKKPTITKAEYTVFAKGVCKRMTVCFNEITLSCNSLSFTGVKKQIDIMQGIKKEIKKHETPSYYKDFKTGMIYVIDEWAEAYECMDVLDVDGMNKHTTNANNKLQDIVSQYGVL